MGINVHMDFDSLHMVGGFRLYLDVDSTEIYGYPFGS